MPAGKLSVAVPVLKSLVLLVAALLFEEWLTALDDEDVGLDVAPTYTVIVFADQAIQ